MFQHVSGSGQKAKGFCKDCARSRSDGGQVFCAIKENFTKKQAPVKPEGSCVAFKSRATA